MRLDPLSDPERIAFAGDWHCNDRWAVACVDHAAEHGVQAIVHVGDFGYDFRPAFVDGLTNALRRTGIPLLFVDGNHDDHAMLARLPVGSNGLGEITDRIWHIPRGFRWQWAGLTWLGCGGAHSVDRQRRTPGVSWWPGETITEADVACCIDGGPVDILVAHDCPHGVRIPGVDEPGRTPPFPPSEIVQANDHRRVLRRVVDGCQPRLIVHGHYHRHYRAEVDFGYGRVSVSGLGMDGTEFDENLWIVDAAELNDLAGS
jgi:Icc-related predicted phosphoesterase